jgi:hypothetical protein
MKTKAIFHKATVVKNAFQEDIKTHTYSFATGCSVSTVKFKDTFESTQMRDGVQLYCTVRKNANTSGVKRQDKVTIQGQDYRVIGIDPMIADFSQMMFLLDLYEGSV